MPRFLMLCMSLFLCTPALIGCEQDNEPVEETGEALEEAGEGLTDAMEDTGERVEDTMQ